MNGCSNPFFFFFLSISSKMRIELVLGVKNDDVGFAVMMTARIATLRPTLMKTGDSGNAGRCRC